MASKASERSRRYLQAAKDQLESLLRTQPSSSNSQNQVPHLTSTTTLHTGVSSEQYPRAIEEASEGSLTAQQSSTNNQYPVTPPSTSPTLYSRRLSLKFLSQAIDEVDSLLSVPPFPAPMDNSTASPLLRLPGELRNQIYRYVLTTAGILVVGHGPVRAGLKHCKVNPGFLRTCRQIYEEGVLILYRENVLYFRDYVTILDVGMKAKLPHMSAVKSVFLSEWGILEGCIVSGLHSFFPEVRSLIVQFQRTTPSLAHLVTGLPEFTPWATGRFLETLAQPGTFKALKELVVIGPLDDKYRKMLTRDDMVIRHAGSVEEALRGIAK